MAPKIGQRAINASKTHPLSILSLLIVGVMAAEPTLATIFPESGIWFRVVRDVLNAVAGVYGINYLQKEIRK